LLAALIQLGFRQQVEGPSEFKVDPTKRYIIGRITEIPLRVKGLFHAQPVILHQMPLLRLFGDEPALSNRNDISLIIHFVRISPEEVK
jgi:hypothetical protein